MFSNYRRVLTLPHALVFSGSGMVARLPIAMASLGIVLLVSTRSGSYSLAGAVSASYLVANAVFAVPQARMIDRLGQSKVLPMAAVFFALGTAALMACVELDVPTPWPHLGAAVAGAAMPQIGSSVRARWSYLVSDKRDLHTAFAFESVVDETVFIVGPALVTLLATALHPLAGLSSAIVATVLGTAVLVGQTQTEPPVGTRTGQDSVEAMPWAALTPLIMCAFLMGTLLGGAEVATVAFSDELGVKPLAGLMLAIWAIGSLLAGLVTGGVHIEASNATRFRWSMVALGLLMLPLPFVHGFVALAVFLFLAGFAISPTLIASFAWIEELVPSSRITEGITVFTTGLGAGLAPGAALVGIVTDSSGASSAFWVTVVAGMLGALIALVTGRGSRLVEPHADSPAGSVN